MLGPRQAQWEKHTTKPMAGFFKAKISTTPKRVVKELRCDAEFATKWEIGQTMKLDEIFQPGMKVDAPRDDARTRSSPASCAAGIFAGAGSDTHGTHEYRRHGGSIGTNMTPGRTLPNLKMGGQYGNETVSILNLKVARVDAEKHLLLIEGGLPGAKNGLVLVRQAVKTNKKSTKR